jgi:hypothetical protein
MTEIDIEKLRSWLREGLHRITFIKSDGTKREMVGTLRADLLPPAPPVVEGETRRTKAAVPGTISVYLPAENAWRSFKVDSLIGMVPLFTPVPPIKG